MQDIFNWMRLHFSHKVSGRAIHRHLQRNPDSLAALVQQYEEQKNCQWISDSDIEQELDFCTQNNVHIITWTDPRYPTLLKQIKNSPVLLFAKGNTDLLLNSKNLVAVVGSRNASLSSLQMTKNITQKLSQHDFITVSGLAQGIDTVTHQESLATGTIAILGSGINVIYPKSNKKLFHEIADKGLLISELSHNTDPYRQYFPTRNRIIAGMSASIIICEAKSNSGSMLSAKYALSYGRKIMAVPGSPLDIRTSGCLELIKSGAVLIDDLMDMITYLKENHCPSFACEDEESISPAPPVDNNSSSPPAEKYFPQFNFKSNKQEPVAEPDHAQQQKMILDLLSFTAVEIDDIIKTTQLPTQTVQAIICLLINEDKVIKEGSCISLKP